jgi:hypothetical protein
LTERGRANQYAARKRWRLNPENKQKELEYKRKRYQMPEVKAEAAEYFQKLPSDKKAERRAKTYEWRRANPDRVKTYNKWAKIRVNYGLTRQDWEAMFITQGSCCAACGTTDPKSKRGWVVDHCHATGAVRGILCRQCNTAAGMCEDDPDRLRRLAKYLEEQETSDVSSITA